jgi:hypothetical protein
MLRSGQAASKDLTAAGSIDAVIGHYADACTACDLVYFRATSIRRQVLDPGFATVRDDIAYMTST